MKEYSVYIVMSGSIVESIWEDIDNARKAITIYVLEAQIRGVKDISENDFSILERKVNKLRD